MARIVGFGEWADEGLMQGTAVESNPSLLLRINRIGDGRRVGVGGNGGTRKTLSDSLRVVTPIIDPRDITRTRLEVWDTLDSLKAVDPQHH